MAAGTLLVMTIFLLGAAMGALVTELNRRMNLSRLRSQFELELRALVEQDAGDEQSSPREAARGACLVMPLQDTQAVSGRGRGDRR